MATKAELEAELIETKAQLYALQSRANDIRITGKANIKFGPEHKHEFIAYVSIAGVKPGALMLEFRDTVAITPCAGNSFIVDLLRFPI